MEFRETGGGFLVPAETRRRKRDGSPTELVDEASRERAYRALSELWDAMDLSSPPKFVVPEKACYDTHMAAWEMLATMLLGDGRPEKEILT